MPALLALTPHDKGLIHNPVGKTKSVMFTEEGLARAIALRDAMFKKA